VAFNLGVLVQIKIGLEKNMNDVKMKKMEVQKQRWYFFFLSANMRLNRSLVSHLYVFSICNLRVGMAGGFWIDDFFSFSDDFWIDDEFFLSGFVFYCLFVGLLGHGWIYWIWIKIFFFLLMWTCTSWVNDNSYFFNGK